MVTIWKDKTPIHIFSESDQWIDYVFLVNTPDSETALLALDGAFDEWKNTGADKSCLDCLCDAMNELDIDYDWYSNNETPGTI